MLGLWPDLLVLIALALGPQDHPPLAAAAGHAVSGDSSGCAQANSGARGGAAAGTGKGWAIPRWSWWVGGWEGGGNMLQVHNAVVDAMPSSKPSVPPPSTLRTTNRTALARAWSIAPAATRWTGCYAASTRCTSATTPGAYVSAQWHSTVRLSADG